MLDQRGRLGDTKQVGIDLIAAKDGPVDVVESPVSHDARHASVEGLKQTGIDTLYAQ
jgi:hypothetical protein